MSDFKMFQFESDLHVGDPKFEVLEGPVRVSPVVLMQDDFFREHQDYGFDFFGAYNVRTKDVNVVATYYPLKSGTARRFGADGAPQGHFLRFAPGTVGCSDLHGLAPEARFGSSLTNGLGRTEDVIDKQSDKSMDYEDEVGYGEVVNLPLTAYEKSELIESIEAFCEKKYKVNCLELVNIQRNSVGLERLEGSIMKGLDQMISNAQEVVRAAEKEKAEKATVTLWARLGVSIDVTPEELASLQNGGRSARELLVSLIQSDRCRLDGETYFPYEANHEHISDELEFDLNPVQLQSWSNRDRER